MHLHACSHSSIMFDTAVAAWDFLAWLGKHLDLIRLNHLCNSLNCFKVNLILINMLTLRSWSVLFMSATGGTGKVMWGIFCKFHQEVIQNASSTETL